MQAISRPASSRKGQSGNPRGRIEGSRNKATLLLDPARHPELGERGAGTSRPPTSPEMAPLLGGQRAGGHSLDHGHAVRDLSGGPRGRQLQAEILSQVYDSAECPKKMESGESELHRMTIYRGLSAANHRLHHHPRPVHQLVTSHRALRGPTTVGLGPWCPMPLNPERQPLRLFSGFFRSTKSGSSSVRQRGRSSWIMFHGIWLSIPE